MKLVIFGLSISSSWGNGHATLWRGLCRALGDDGHTVIFFERETPYYNSTRDMTTVPGCELRLYSSWPEAMATARRDLSDADVGMVTSYCPDGQAASELLLESNIGVRAFYDLDTPVTLDRLAAGEAVDYIPLNGLRDFDIVLSYTGGRALAQLKEVLGARRVAPLYGSVDPRVHYPATGQTQYQCDISYLGTYAEDRQEGLNRLFVEAARNLPNRRFLIGGAQYPHSFPWAENIYFVRHLPPSEHASFYGASRLTLNVTRRAMASMGFCPSGRLFEAAACQVPLLTDAWEGLEDFYTPGKEALVCRTTEDVIGAMELEDSELARIARAGRERTLGAHTAAHRAEEMIAILEGARTPCKSERAATQP
jgi:spore maturation protein CgeB